MRGMHQRTTRFILALGFWTSGVLVVSDQNVLAEVATAITSSGLNTHISAPTLLPNGQITHDITGGTRPGNGPNLFHSFGDFSVGNNNIANFLNDSGLATSNILGRVTGGNTSNIFGTIQTTGFGNANLFLMNPAGFLFGPTAAVNVGGMMTLTSADYLRLADGAQFKAVPNAAADALLSAAPVAAFGFLGSNPGAITVQGSQLTVSDGTGISLVGGKISVQAGTLTAPSGQINLVSVNKPSNHHVGGEVVVNGAGPSSGLVPTGFKSLGTIALTQGSTVDTSTTANNLGGAAGGVLIRGGQFVMDASSIISVVKNVDGAEGTSGNIEVTANTVSLANQSSIHTGNTVCCTSFPSPGNIIVNTKTFSATDSGMRISTGSFGGFGPYIRGSIIIQGLEGAGSSARLVSLTHSTLSAGGAEPFEGGSIRIRAKDVSLNQAGLGTSSSSGGGPISIVAERQILSMDSSLDASSLFFFPGGPINLQAGARINLTNTTLSTSGFASISLSAPVVSVRGGGISAEGGLVATGNISIDATREVRITDGARISVDSGVGQGSITINAGHRFVSENSTISAQSQGGNGGTIHVQADHAIKLTDSTLTTSSSGIFGDPENAGGIGLESKVVTLQNSQVLSKGEGQGGTINITATHLVVEDAASVISATSATGPNGSVTITAPVTILKGVVEP